MRIGIDGFNLAMSRGTGIATYGRTLSHCLKELGYEVDVLYGMDISQSTRPVMREIIFFETLEQEQTRKRPKFFSANWFRDRMAGFAGYNAVEVSISGRLDGRSFTERMPAYDRILNVSSLFRNATRYFNRTGRFLRVSVKNPPDVMHWTYPLPIRLNGAKNIYTVHDLVPLRLPHATLDNKTAHFRLISTIAKSADAICTVSEASRNDIVSFFPEATSKIINTYQSLSAKAQVTAGVAASAGPPNGDSFGLTADGYFLFFGSLEPKKNIGRMVDAVLGGRPSRPLVLVGARSWKTEEELRSVKRAEELGCVIRLDYLSETVLMRLIQNARAVLFPSLTEGFGLPVLEALSLGTPVLTSREGALPEVTGEAAVFVDAYDPLSIADGILRLDTDDALCARLRLQGPLQAAKFSSQAYREKLEHMYLWVVSR